MNYLVIKCGGSIFEQLPPSFYQDIVDLQTYGGFAPIIVHGGGPTISNLLSQLNIETTFHNGLRVTTDDVLDVVEMVLSGLVNKQVVRSFTAIGGKAVGISGTDGQLLKAEPIEQDSPLGFVGQVTGVETAMIQQLASQNQIPVISPLSADVHGQRYNINADMAAAAIAQALEARLCFVSDIPGIYTTEASQPSILSTVSQEQIEDLIASGEISGGMIPKVRAAMESLSHHVPEVGIINGLEPHSLPAFINGETIGTTITLDEEGTHAK